MLDSVLRCLIGKNPSYTIEPRQITARSVISFLSLTKHGMAMNTKKLTGDLLMTMNFLCNPNFVRLTTLNFLVASLPCLYLSVKDWLAECWLRRRRFLRFHNRLHGTLGDSIGGKAVLAGGSTGESMCV